MAAEAQAHVPRILVVDDDEGMLILMAEALRAEDFEVTTADSARAARSWLDQHAPDLMILDLKLQDAEGPAVAGKLQEGETKVPFIVVTGQGDEKVAVEVMKQGALDYVMKDSGLLDLLPTVVKRALGRVSQEKALHAAHGERRRLEQEIVAISERERHSIGADLHDGLGQQLTAIALMCAALKEDAVSHPALAKGLDQMDRMLREAVMQTRFLARGLVPIGTEVDALQIGLAELAARMNALSRVHCEFEAREEITVDDPAVATHLYRIAQEAVNNAIKHARARSIVIRLIREKGTLDLEVADDGVGLPKSRGEDRGVGLGVMRHRASLIGAEMTISARRGGGTLIRCRLPVKK